MPLYEYQCPECGTFERMQKFSDPILTACPSCEKPVEKLLSAPAIQFKGTGWYVTDYADKSSGKEEGAKAGETKASDGKDKSTSKDAGDTKKPSSATPKSSGTDKK